MNYPKEFDELINNFYEIERILTAIEKKPRTYGTDQLLHSGEAHTLKAIAENEGITQKDKTQFIKPKKPQTNIII